MHARADKEQLALAKRLDRLRKKESKSPMLQKRLDELTAKAHQTPTKAAARGAKQRDRKRAASSLLSRLRKEHEDWCDIHFPSQPQSRRPPELQNRQPYPGLVNLGNTCYVNAVCQVLLHCDAARHWLRNRSEGMFPEEASASIADDDSASLVQEMRSLAEHLADGLEEADDRHRSDVWSPHALLDAFLRCRPLQLGE